MCSENISLPPPYFQIEAASSPNAHKVTPVNTCILPPEYEHVIEKTFVEEIRADPEPSFTWTSLTDGTLLYDGVIPISFHIIDNRVLIWLGESRGEIAGLLECENAEVLSWAESLYDEYRSGAEPFPE